MSQTADAGVLFLWLRNTGRIAVVYYGILSES